MKVEELIKLLQSYNKNYKVELITNHGYPEVVIKDFNNRILGILSL